MSNGLSIKGGSAPGVLRSNELLILNAKFFLDVSCTYRCISEMENGSNLHSTAAAPASSSSRKEQFVIFFNPLRINKGKKAEY